MTTLVTGATGFVDSHVARKLVDAGHSVRVLVRSSSNLQLLEGLPVERIEGDLRDPRSLERAMSGVRRLFHVAADYRLWTRTPEELYKSNVEGTRSLFQAAGRADVERVVAGTVARFGGLDFLVNNAGVGIFAEVADMTPGQWDEVIDTTLPGVFRMCHAAIPHLRTRGGGFIINISSLAGKNAFAGGAAYNASKFGLNGFSEALLMDTRYDNVRVSTVMPGSVATEFGRGAAGGDTGTASSRQEAASSEQEEDWKVHPEDVAEVVRMLLQMPERTMVSQVEIHPAKPKRS